MYIVVISFHLLHGWAFSQGHNVRVIHSFDSRGIYVKSHLDKSLQITRYCSSFPLYLIVSCEPPYSQVNRHYFQSLLHVVCNLFIVYSCILQCTHIVNFLHVTATLYAFKAAKKRKNMLSSLHIIL
jgi:hypothetical protein